MTDMKRREDKRLLDEKKEKDRARLEKEEQARKEAAKISREFGRDVAKTKEEEQRQLLAGEKLRVAISKITRKNETSRMRHFILLAKEHAKDEAKKAEFERTTRERRDENEAARQAEKARAARVREQLLQKDFVKRTAVEEAVFQAKPAKDQEEKRQQLRMEVERLERYLGFLATVGSTAPFVGLFGTVWGIMNSFTSIAAQESASLSVVAPGIAEALFATAVGLVAAIPAVIAYNKFAADMERFANRLEGFVDEFNTILSRQIDEGQA